MQYEILLSRTIKLMNEVHDLADQIDISTLNAKDRIFNSGIVLEESEYMVELAKENWKHDPTVINYYEFLKHAKSFYGKLSRR